MFTKLSAFTLLGLALAGLNASQANAQATKTSLARMTPPATAAATPPGAAAATTVEARANALTASMSQGLGLTPAQTEKVRVINTNSVRNVEAARLHYHQEPAKLRSYIEDIGTARLDQLKDVLSPAQFAR